MLTKVNFSITQLEYVMAVYKNGHFAKAAEACFVTQPTLSMQIQKLEEDLGIIIFDRSKKPILLTEVGRKLIEQIQLILFEVKKIEGILIKSTDAMAGRLVLGIIPTVAPYLLPKLLPVIEQKFPLVELNIKELQTDRIVESLNNDEIDVGILATPLKIAKIFELPIFYESFFVLCQKNHAYSSLKKIKYSSLKQEDVWLLEEGHCLRHQVLDVCSIKKGVSKKRRFQFESGSLETLKNLVESYGGYTLLPQLATENLGKHCVLVPFEKPIPAREIGLVYRREHYKSELIQSLAQCISECIPEHLRQTKSKDLDVLPIQ